jgi:uncharacterized membrane protein (UPF0127 family)
MAAHFLQPLLDSPPDAFLLTIVRDGSPLATPLATAIEVAFDSDSRRRGLLGRDSLADRTAMIIAPCQLVHTFAMRFSIDIVFVDRTGTVVKVREDVRSRHIAGAWSAFAVIELAAGAIARSGLRRGDRLTLVQEIHKVADSQSN